MTIPTSLSRSAFVDILGCTLARWYWDGQDKVGTFSSSDYKAADLGLLRQILPDQPESQYGTDIFSVVLKTTKQVWKDQTAKRSVMVKYRTCSLVAKAMSVQTMRAWNTLVQESMSVNDLPFPVSPNKRYIDEWAGWPAFLGMDVVQFFSYDQARSLVTKLQIKTVQEYRDYIASGLADPRMPSRPDSVYSDRWTGWPAFLTSRFVTYAEAKELIAPFALKGEQQYRLLGTKGERPEGIPSHPATFYAGEWEGWSAFLGGGVKKRRAK